jgi:energy-coupling factor transport system permease protein
MMMFRSIPLGVYYPGNSIVHRMQARTKLLLIVWLIVWLELATHHEWNFAPFIVLVVVVGASIACARIAAREVWRRTWLILIFFLLGLGPTLPTTDVDPRLLAALGPLITTYGFAHIMLLIVGSVFALLFLSSLLPALRVFWRRGWLKFLRILNLLVALLAFALFWLIASNPATQAFSIGPYSITYGGTWTFMSSFCVLMALLIFALILTMTTSPVALIEGVTLLLSPLRYLRLPVDDFALMTLLALRFIPTLVDETEQLIKAQSARGADLANGTMLERLHSLSMLFVPLMQGSLRRASDLATALEARGYKVDGKQTMLHETTFGRVDFVVAGLVVSVTAMALLF